MEEERANRREAIGESSAYVVPDREFSSRAAITVAIDNRQPMETRRKMVSWLHEHEPTLIAPLYDVLEDRPMKRYVLEYLAKLDNEKVSKKLLEIARGDSDPEMRQVAAASLRAHTNAFARSYR